MTAPSDEQRDGINGLKAMSTTAGLGHDYTEINAWAVFAAVAAVLGAAAVLTPLALPLPLAAAIAGLVALGQISRSGGTQTGRVLAIVAVVLGGFWIVYGSIGLFAGGAAQRTAVEEIDAHSEQLGALIATGDFDAAYDMAHPVLQQTVSSQRWKRTFRALATGDRPLRRLATSGQVNLARSGETELAETMLLFHRANVDEPTRFEASFAKLDGRWRLLAIPDLFPAG
jgi:hypothetical protein